MKNGCPYLKRHGVCVHITYNCGGTKKRFCGYKRARLCPLYNKSKSKLILPLRALEGYSKKGEGFNNATL